jgi:uncharacterized protein YbaP (TraB family)
MLFRRSKEKELKMIWEVAKDRKRSLLVGTAHFFPYSFKTSLLRCLQNARTVLFEGPLDSDSMAEVVAAGFDRQKHYHLFDELDPKTIDGITRELVPRCRDQNTFLIMNLRWLRMENPVYEMVKEMKPWLAFFTIWSDYLKNKDWQYSVDLEGYGIAGELGKKIVALETIEEQIRVLENISRERIINFLRKVDLWHKLIRDYVACYLDGDLEKLKSIGPGFPSRHYSVIDHRDEIFFMRMREYIAQGDTVAFVGAPHIQGLSQLLRADGYQIKGPLIPLAGAEWLEAVTQ